MVNKAAHEPPALTEGELLRAPWMKKALGELGKGVHEFPGSGGFEHEYYLALSQNNPRFSLLDWDNLNQQTAKKLSRLDGMQMEVTNLDVSKYLASTGLSNLTKVDTKKDGSPEWRMQAWCAAFVNWCLRECGIKPLNSACAAAWLKFGTPVYHPEKGAIVVLKPNPTWEVKGGSGHAAFLGGVEGSHIWILGGNQGRKVSWITKDISAVRGYRWPKELGDFGAKAQTALST